ncbi:hypothetical protein [Nonomuraea sp. NPDC049784]|uniref:hypothetical protein n=1 Tax=Nonomuraea sp. NPDC049784 TaxID=3154361 RepID=UPI0033E96C9C
MKIETKVEPYQKYLVFGVAITFVGGLIVFGGWWAFVIAVVCLAAGTMFGLVVGVVMAHRDIEAEMTALRAQYDAASELAYKLAGECNAQAERAESAERDLIATVAEKTSLRAQLDGLQPDATA